MNLQSLYFALRYPKVAGVQLWGKYKERQNPPYDPDGINIHDEDWDILLILDACRYDVFSDRVTIPGELQKKRSRGSTSQEWLWGNFLEDTYGDLVVVSANPFWKKLAERINIQVHHFEWVEPTNDKTGLTPPENVTDRVLDMAQEYPNKRILAHYMQPHAPYLGENGRSIKYEFTQLHRAVKDNIEFSSKIWDAYRENFDIVQEAIKPVVDANYGKTVISADHGEMLGEPLIYNINMTSYYGHPYGISHDCVRSVPWHIVEQKEEYRRDITDDGAYPVDSVDVEDQLQALGYM